ncbi:hypothetical protein [uncultured Dokdonia sp.]|uniref:hypothetical protein n=1 Tax=uncultured Dokdonia sp. TaxID=575653 RepID=UPI00262577EF|nr:hypothetical protein [uncultured Dokdonia sp.]
MRNKWYVSALIFALAIVGISLEQVSVPNQEIVLQFADLEVTLDETQDAITQIKSQLEALEVDNIQIQESGNGTLKITYYSDIDVSEVKKIFLEDIDLAISHTSYDFDKENTRLPSKEDRKPYQLDVYEIQENIDIAGSSGNIVELKSEIIRFFTPDTYASISKQRNEEKNKTEKLAYIVHRNIAIAIDDASYNIPEVRAGPTT